MSQARKQIEDLVSGGDDEKGLELILTDAAATELRGALSDGEPGDLVRITIDASFKTTMELSPREAGDTVIESKGLGIVLNAESSARANGLKIDFLDTPQRTGFKIDNPNAPAKIEEISPSDLQAKLASSEIVALFDVRTEQERSMAKIDGARLLDENAAEHIESLDRNTAIAFHCHHGIRSRSAAQHFLAMGFRNLFNLSGGIDAWSLEVDSTIPRY